HQRGSHVVWRSFPQQVLGFVMPTIVIVDEEEQTALFQPTGTICKRRKGRRGGPRGRSMLPGGWDGTYYDWTFPGPPNVKLHIRAEGFTVFRTWDQSKQSFTGWYVNLESPWRRTPIGFDSRDLVLDVTVSDDLSSLEWKDEDEVEYALSNGMLTRQEADLARTQGMRAIELIESRAFPFSEEWERFSPNSFLGQVPEVGASWSELFAADGSNDPAPASSP
ncbi:MAG: DUF402 domain-containing protein, partial [Acidimicrobiia bacterium]